MTADVTVTGGTTTATTSSHTIANIDADFALRAIYDALAAAGVPNLPAYPDLGAGEGDLVQLVIAGTARLSSGNGKVVSITLLDKESS